MTIAEWILLPTLGLAFYNVGIIWLMQVHVYPLFKLVGEDEWIPYHTAHWHRIRGVVFVPAGLVLLGAILLMFFRPEAVPGWSLWLGLGVQVVLYALTAVVWAPRCRSGSPRATGSIRGYTRRSCGPTGDGSPSSRSTRSWCSG